jgi:hypothetical protein
MSPSCALYSDKCYKIAYHLCRLGILPMSQEAPMSGIYASDFTEILACAVLSTTSRWILTPPPVRSFTAQGCFLLAS